MGDCKTCSDAGDGSQASPQENESLHARDVLEAHDARDVLEAHVEDGINDNVSEDVNQIGGEMNQACASLSSYGSNLKSECCFGTSEDFEPIVAQCGDTCMVEMPKKANLYTGEKFMDEGNEEELNIACGVMGLNELEGFGLREMVENEKRDSFDDVDHPHLGGVYLDELDDDVLLHIASFLEARVVKYALSKVCVRFQDIFDSEAYWKSRILKRWPKKYPAVNPLPDFNWLDACVEREDCHRVWNNPATNTQHFMYSRNVFAEVDCVHLMKKGQLLVSGDRNRNMNMIDLHQYKHDTEGPLRDANFRDMLVHSDCSTHKGWIWCMTSVDNQLVTGSWDMYIRLFDINSQMVPFSSYKCKSAVLSLFVEENEIVASCFDKKVYFIDRRSSEINSRNFHKQPVLSVSGNDQFIISGSEDKTISVFDRKAGKILRRITLDHYPLCMSYRDNHLWCGDKCGQLHLYDASQGLFQHVGMYDIGHTDKITGVLSTRGAIFTCSGDKTVKVHTPSQDPDVVASLEVHKKEIAWLDYSHGVLVSAGGDDGIGVWLPKHWDVNTYLL